MAGPCGSLGRSGVEHDLGVLVSATRRLALRSTAVRRRNPMPQVAQTETSPVVGSGWPAVGLFAIPYSSCRDLMVWVCGYVDSQAGVMQPQLALVTRRTELLATTGLAQVPMAANVGAQAAWQHKRPARDDAWSAHGSRRSTSRSRVINNGTGHGGGFYWKGGNVTICRFGGAGRAPNFRSPYFGWQIICRRRSCSRPEGVRARRARMSSNSER